jgi:AcrR family transcriptional regulator
MISGSNDLRPAVPSVATVERWRRASAPGEKRKAAWSETRSRIVETAERLFRQVGHQKTTVADIAHMLSMSPANIYRFFGSKDAISEAVCRRLLEELLSVATEIARRSATAEERLRALLVELVRLNVERFRTDKSLQQLLAVAVSENWSSVTDYVERMESVLAAIVTDGMKRGEFRKGDAQQVGRCVHTGMMRYLHPTLVLECGATGQPTLDDMMDFCLAALRESRGTRQSIRDSGGHHEFQSE